MFNSPLTLERESGRGDGARATFLADVTGAGNEERLHMCLQPCISVVLNEEIDC